MKKISITVICIFIALSVIFTVFFGSKYSNTKENVTLQDPPSLTVICANESIDATRITTSWHYKNADGTFSGINADSPHPLELKDSMSYIILKPTPYSSINPLTAYLSWETAPDKVYVRSWSEEHWGNTDASGENIDITVTSDGLHYINLHEDNCVYEVVAEWSSSAEYGGTVYYCFYTQNSLIFNFDVNELKPIN